MTVGELIKQLQDGIARGGFAPDTFLETEGCDCIGPASGIYVRTEDGHQVVCVTRDDSIERPWRPGRAAADACTETDGCVAPVEPPAEHITRTFESNPAKKED